MLCRDIRFHCKSRSSSRQTMPGCTGISVAGIGLAEENTCAQDMFRLNIELPWCLHNWKVLHLHLSYPCYLGAMSIGDRMQLPCTTVSMNDMRASTVHAHLLPILRAPQRRASMTLDPTETMFLACRMQSSACSCGGGPDVGAAWHGTRAGSSPTN